MDLTPDNLLILLKNKTRRPEKFSELMKSLKVPESKRREFRSVIKEMVSQGTLVKLRGGRYGLPDEMNLIPGVLSGHPDGYGFLVIEGDEPDVYIGPKKMNGAMHKDQVLVRLEADKRSTYTRPEGRVVRILERRTHMLVGVFEPLGRDGWVIPVDDKYFHDVFIPSKNKNGAKPGQMVSVDLIDYPTRHQPPIGKVTEVLGQADDPEVELRSIFHKFGVHQEFPPDALEEAHAAPNQVRPQDREGRRDLTPDMLFTIDGERAKDFDDAVSLERVGDHWRLGVHIADVSHYVVEGTPLDKEAFERGTSIYFPDGVIPMLPVELSNDICSLKPDVERLALTALMDMDDEGALLKLELFPSVILSKHRMTYTQVARAFETGEPEENWGEDAWLMLKDMHAFSQVLRKRRLKEGSIDFLVPEAEVQMNPDGTVANITVAQRNDAHMLVEEFMLSANRAVARYLDKKNVPLVHRIHEPPNPEKLEDFTGFIESLGHRMPRSKKRSSKDLQNLLKKVRGKPEERVINTLLLRAMKKAVYSEEGIGHFALGFEDYAHFTSPIRRYPDLSIHRMVKAFVKKKKASTKEYKHLRPKSAEIAEQSSTMEQKAQSIEREVNDLRRAQFMEDKIGQAYNGIISGVTSFGFFVEMVEVFVEGLVRLSNLKDDYYIFYETEHILKGQHKGKTYAIGDKVKVRVASVDIPRRRIDLTLATASSR